jgi:hypothetical protein
MATKLKQKTFNVMVRLNLDVGFEISAESLQAAIAKAEALTVSDIIDFKELGLDHNDSDKTITGVFH